MDADRTRHYVLNENALVYRRPGHAWLGVLAGSVLRGGPGPMTGTLPPPLACDSLREATLEDFAAYRVSPRGHLA